MEGAACCWNVLATIRCSHLIRVLRVPDALTESSKQLGDVVWNRSDCVLVINVAQQSTYALDHSFPNQAIFWQRFHNHTSRGGAHCQVNDSGDCRGSIPS